MASKCNTLLLLVVAILLSLCHLTSMSETRNPLGSYENMRASNLINPHHQSDLQSMENEVGSGQKWAAAAADIISSRVLVQVNDYSPEANHRHIPPAA